MLLAAAGPDPAASALSAVARDAIGLFATADALRLRECASPECGLLFLDLSRPGRRRWCSSNACGGKARAAAYRQRRQPPTRNPLTVTSAELDFPRAATPSRCTTCWACSSGTAPEQARAHSERLRSPSAFSSSRRADQITLYADVNRMPM